MARTADRLITEIKREIARGDLLPGDQLEEAALAKRFGVSRTPIREAIRAMVDCGLLETKPRKGAIVCVLSAKELLDLFEVAAELEGMACRLAAASLTASDENALKAALSECEAAAAARDIPRYSTANLQFHRAIHVASGNQWLKDHLEQIELRINAYRSMPYEVRGRLSKSLDEHAEICEAILSGDGNHACELMKDHMMLQGKRLPSIINTVEGHHAN